MFTKSANFWRDGDPQKYNCEYAEFVASSKFTYLEIYIPRKSVRIWHLYIIMIVTMQAIDLNGPFFVHTVIINAQA